MAYKLIILSFIGIIIGCADRDKNFFDHSYETKMIKTGKRIYDRGLTFGSGGDLSVRITETDSIIIKATGASLGYLDHGKLVRMHIDGTKRAGDPEPSHEAIIHCAVYRMRKDAGAIMHMHSPYATAWATAGKKIPLVTQQSANILKNIAFVGYHKVGSEEFNSRVIEAYKNPETQVVLLGNHGVFVIGKDLDDLFFKSDVVENTARIAFISQMIGEPILPQFK